LTFKKIKTKSTIYLAEIPDFMPGVARTNKHVRTFNNKETQFLTICRKLKLDDFKEVRAENQKAQRLEKRKKAG